MTDKKPHSPWMTAQEAADYIRSPNVKAFYEWRKRNQVAAALYGRKLRMTKADLDKAMNKQAA